ncbi:MAG TPA: hypothetical protein VGK67_12365 [Myxococcales bacterium]
MPRSVPALLVAFALLLLAGCDRYDKRDRPLPKFSATTLDGKPIDPAFLAGKPWVIHLWVPG